MEARISGQDSLRTGRRNKRRRAKTLGYVFCAVAALGAVAIIMGIVYIGLKTRGGGSPGADDGGIDIGGPSESFFSAGESGVEVEEHYWNIRVSYEGQSEQVELHTLQAEQEIEEAVTRLAEKWDVPAAQCELSEYDKESGTFKFTDGHEGTEIDREKLKADLEAAVTNGDYEAEIEVTANTVQPTISREDYGTIAEYTTKATSNSNRNTNIRLASASVNGTIVPAGGQFSFNQTVGRRSEERGYKQAAAYLEGQTVQEYGGGVCQVSSTLYNAVIIAGLRSDERVGHTFEPNYVTPGQDATVSYEKPDFVFTNTSATTVGIKTSFADQIMHVEIYGVSSLPEGVKRYMESEETGDAADPGSTYIEDPSIPYGSEVVVKNPMPGKKWTTYVVTEKNGEVIEREYLHATVYKGKAGVIKRNTNAATAVPATPAAPVVPGILLPDGTYYVPGVTPGAVPTVPAAPVVPDPSAVPAQ